MFVIKNKLLLSYRRVKSMHQPESPKVTTLSSLVKMCSLDVPILFEIPFSMALCALRVCALFFLSLSISLLYLLFLPFLSLLCHQQINRRNFNIFKFKVGSTPSLCKVGENPQCLIYPFCVHGINLKKKLGLILQAKLKVHCNKKIQYKN